MTNKERLEKAIKKAVENGFYLNEFIGEEGQIDFSITEYDEVFFHPRHSGVSKDAFVDAFTIIFDHRFAKAFWGEGKKIDDHDFEEAMFDGKPAYEWEGLISIHKRWESYLQNMVLKEDPIKYLEQFL